MNLKFSGSCMKHMVVPDRLRRKLLVLNLTNVVSHGTSVTARPHRRATVYGTTNTTHVKHSPVLTAHSISKFGSSSRHCRINTVPRHKNYGKFLVFYSSNMIRAGKHSPADAMSNALMFSRWVRRATLQRYVWHTAMSAPNMVLSGRLTEPLPESVKDHWSASHSDKFPGISITTTGTCTPELYMSGSFIIPGVTTIDSLNIALKAIDVALHGAEQ